MDREKLIEEIEKTFGEVQEGEIYRSLVNELEKVVIEKALKRSAGNQISAAKILGLHRNTLRTKIRKLDIKLTQFKGYSAVISA